MQIGAAANAQTFPDRDAVVCGPVRYTWSQWNARINQLAHAMRALGLDEGDKIAMLLQNRHEFLEIGQAAIKIGAVMVPLNYRLRGREIEYILNNSDARALFTSEEFLPEIVPLMDAVPGVGRGSYVLVGTGEAPGFTPYERLLAGQPTSEPPEQGTPGMNAMIYTSGTTGRPKGVFRKGGIDPQLLMGIIQGFGLQYGAEVQIVPAPLYHSAPSLGSSLTIALGGTVVIMEKFDPEEFLALIDREKVTSSLVVPTIVKRVLALPDEVKRRYDVSSLHSLIVGAAPFPLETKRAAIEFFGDCVYEYYGSTDAGLNTILPPSEQRARPASCGKIVPGTDIRILDDEGRELPTGEVGNIYVSNALVTAMQYYKDPEKTRSAFRGEHMTVGDMGYLDADGYLYIVDRKTDMVISGGVNIYPAEIEEVIYEHDAVLDVAVIGVPNDDWGEELKAVVQLKPGAHASADDIIDFCRERLADYKRPRTVDFVAEVPRNPSGKLLKREIRARYWEGRERRV
ncbi:MAG TPA: AMP-binding protein [Candidatus Binatia bacterium]